MTMTETATRPTSGETTGAELATFEVAVSSWSQEVDRETPGAYPTMSLNGYPSAYRTDDAYGEYPSAATGEPTRFFVDRMRGDLVVLPTSHSTLPRLLDCGAIRPVGVAEESEREQLAAQMKALRTRKEALDARAEERQGAAESATAAARDLSAAA